MEVHRNRLGIIFGCLAVVAVTLLLDSYELTARNEVVPVSTNVSAELPTCRAFPAVCNSRGMPETRKKQLKAARRMYGSIFGMGGASFACCVIASFVIGVSMQFFVIRHFQVSSSGGRAGDVEVSEPAWVCWWSSPFRFTFPLMTMKLYVSGWRIVSFVLNHVVELMDLWIFCGVFPLKTT